MQLTQRVRLRFHLSRAVESGDFCDTSITAWRWRGSQGRKIFDEDTYATIYRYTGGTPRLVNTLCDAAAVAAFGREKDTVKRSKISMRRYANYNERNSASSTNRVRAPDMPPANAPSIKDQSPRSQAVGRILLASEGKTVLERETASGRLNDRAPRRITICKSTANSSAAITAKSSRNWIPA